MRDGGEKGKRVQGAPTGAQMSPDSAEFRSQRFE